MFTVQELHCCVERPVAIKPPDRSILVLGGALISPAVFALVETTSNG